MLALIQLFALLLAFSISIYADEFEVNTQGFAAPNEQLEVTFNNLYADRAISVYWDGGDGTTVKMNDVPASGTIIIQTFLGHTFFATELGDDDARLDPFEVLKYFNFF
jgi:hypothetical protein